MPFAEGEAVILLKQENGRLIAENARARAEGKALEDWVTYFLHEELDVDYSDLDHVSGCKKCWIDWNARGMHLCDDYEKSDDE